MHRPELKAQSANGDDHAFGFGCLAMLVFLVGAVGIPLYQAGFWLKEGFWPEVTLATKFGYPRDLARWDWVGLQKITLWFYELHLSISLAIALISLAIASVVAPAVLRWLFDLISDSFPKRT